ncbi:ADP-ribosylglycohydrolase [Tupanvirus deep ocean]|uniref:ADP-ribosylglycohydrolase n=2 Tax=Tupanvirus TaxID=2094720 RepID=A0AC62A905_9VIRU|nr:ADP-ribosylglycohydrolase [Tupanvirus deep ocean]QKU34123.1 ADP-ribosylglycohydrolase [Tupanvirus deep ocean]
MSENINMDNNSNNLVELIENTLSISRGIIVDMLMKKYNYDKKNAFRIEDIIYTQTRSSLLERYNFMDEFVFYKNRGKIDEKFQPTMSEYPEFIGWTSIIMSIPFYQSLGDTIGYHNGNWEFNYGNVREGPDYVNDLIYEFIDLGGVNDMSIKNLYASDDTILYLATLEVLVNTFNSINDFGEIVKNAYIDTLPLIENRHPGNTTQISLEIQKNIAWDKLPYNNKAIAAGSAMRSGCIGMFFPGTHNRKRLVALSVESSRITHNSAIAILASVTAALFTAYSLEKVPINEWPNKLIKLLDSGLVDDYIKESRPNDFQDYMRDKILYVGQWRKYLELLFTGTKPKMDIKTMKNPVQRYKYLIDNFSKGCDIPGSCGDDALIMAYDSLLRSVGTFEKLIVFSVLHPGDSDTVGSIAFSWYGGVYHNPRNEAIVGHFFSDLEFHDKIYDLMEKSIGAFVKIFYHDIYLHIAAKYLKKYAK